MFCFIFKGVCGWADNNDFVRWGGASFQIEAALPDLRAAIEKARKHH